jgi:hypothetical protein
MDVNIDNLVVYGCSLTKDNYIDTWADYLAAHLKLPLINNAERGAGYEFISSSLVNTLLDIKHPLCVVMWPSCDRVDLWVNDSTPQLQQDLNYASWLDGKQPLFCDLNNNYSKTNGYYLSGAVPRGIKHTYYKNFYSSESHMNHALKTIVLTQHYLGYHGIPYVMCSSHPVNNLVQYHDDASCDYEKTFMDQINFDNFVNDSRQHGFINSIKGKGFGWVNAHYPNTDAHEWYVDNKVIPLLRKNILS